MRAPTFLSVIFHLISAFPFTLAHSSNAPFPPAVSPTALHRRVLETSHALTDCRLSYNEHSPAGAHDSWTFQQSHCVRNSIVKAPYHFRRYRIDCRAPGTPSMLEGLVAADQEEYVIGYCTPTQICVDGPYTPPNPALLFLRWYKKYGTAYCVEQQHLVDMGRDGLHVLGQREGGAGHAGSVGNGGAAG
ncbi:hypothetical protein MMC26_001696 [Xylographa opegraphella]|nr:hypothetical protein [Xylographa opegraphella]